MPSRRTRAQHLAVTEIPQVMELAADDVQGMMFKVLMNACLAEEEVIPNNFNITNHLPVEMEFCISLSE